MKAPRLALAGILGLGLLAAPLAAVAQPALDNFRFDPPRVCARDTLRWESRIGDFPAAWRPRKEVSMEGLWEGPGERPMRSLLTPARDDLQPYTADQGRFESRILHAGPAREGTARRCRDPIHAAGSARRRPGSRDRDVGALRGRLSAARAPDVARGRAHRPHRPRDHHADDPGVPERDQARHHQPDLGRPRATAGRG